MQVSVFREPAFEKNALHEYLDNEDAESNIASTAAAVAGGGYDYGGGYAGSASASGGGGGWGGSGWGGSRGGDADGVGVSVSDGDEKKRRGQEMDAGGEMEMEVEVRRVVANLLVAVRVVTRCCCLSLVFVVVSCLVLHVLPCVCVSYICTLFQNMCVYLRPSWVAQVGARSCFAPSLQCRYHCVGRLYRAVWPGRLFILLLSCHNFVWCRVTL